MDDRERGAYEDWAEMEELEECRRREARSAESPELARLRRLAAEAKAKGIPEAQYIQEMDGVLL